MDTDTEDEMRAPMPLTHFRPQCWLPHPATIVERIKGCLHQGPTILALASDADNAYIQACHHQPAKTNTARVAQPATHACPKAIMQAGIGTQAKFCNMKQSNAPIVAIPSHMHCCLPRRTGGAQAVSHLGWPSSSTAANSAAVSFFHRILSNAAIAP